MQDYINPLPQTAKPVTDVKIDGQKTPQRITIIYQTTGVFQDIGEEGRDESGEIVPG